jgi:hypothetical protein
LVNPGEGGLFLGSVSCWALTHVPIQHSFADAVCRTQPILSIKRTNPVALVFFNILIFISVSALELFKRAVDDY